MPAPIPLPAGREVGDRGIRGRVGRARRRQHHGGAGTIGGGVEGDPGLAQAPLQGGKQQRVRAEGVGAADVDGGDAAGRAGRGRKLRGNIRLAVIRGGQQQRHQDDVRPARRAHAAPPAPGERGQDAGQRRRAVVEERGPHVDRAAGRFRRPRRHDAKQFTDRGRRARVLRPVGNGDKRGMASGGSQGQTWMPHSVLPVPAHRPDRGSAPASTRIVQVRQPIDGYPS